MFGHYDIPHHHEAVTFPGLFQHGEEAVAASSGTQKGQAATAGTGDKVQVLGTVVTMLAASHGEHYGISDIAAHPFDSAQGRLLQKTQGWGTHVSSGEKKNRAWTSVGHPSARTRLIEDRLASRTKNGYQFVIQNCVRPEKGEGKYQVVAYPVSRMFR